MSRGRTGLGCRTASNYNRVQANDRTLQIQGEVQASVEEERGIRNGLNAAARSLEEMGASVGVQTSHWARAEKPNPIKKVLM